MRTCIRGSIKCNSGHRSPNTRFVRAHGGSTNGFASWRLAPIGRFPLRGRAGVKPALPCANASREASTPPRRPEGYRNIIGGVERGVGIKTSSKFRQIHLELPSFGIDSSWFNVAVCQTNKIPYASPTLETSTKKHPPTEPISQQNSIRMGTFPV